MGEMNGTERKNHPVMTTLCQPSFATPTPSPLKASPRLGYYCALIDLLLLFLVVASG